MKYGFVTLLTLLAVALSARAGAAQSLTAEADTTVGATTESIAAAASQIRTFGTLGGWRFYGDATWARRRGHESDVFGAAYPYEPGLRLMELYAEKTVVRGNAVLGTRLGRYRTPFGLYGRSDHGYTGFLRAPMVRYSDYWALSNNYLESGANVMAGTTWLTGEVSLGTATDEDEYSRPGGLNGVARLQGTAGAWIVGASYIRTRPSRTWWFASGRAEFTGVDARWMNYGVLLRGEWLEGRPFAQARTRGGYVDALVHRPFMGPVTGLARVERLDYFAGRFSRFPRRYSVGAKIRVTPTLTAQINQVHQPRDRTGLEGHTSLDAALTYTIRVRP